jgi:signal peptidase I
MNPAAPPRSSRRLATLRPWLLGLLGALVAAIFLRACVAEAFRIPTASMERTLLVGDYVLASKVHYGPRTPETLRIPFSAQRIAGLRLPAARLPGLTHVRHGEVLVFFHPGEFGPVDSRTAYIKRVAGVPGDTLVIRSKRLFVNGEPLHFEQVQHDWLVTLHPDSALGPEAIVGHSQAERAGLRAWRLPATRAEADVLRSRPAVEAVEPAPGRPDGALFPPGQRDTPDDYGPLVIPRAGVPLRISEATWPAIHFTLEREGRRARRLAAGYYEIDGALTDTVSFRQDYYFVLGDNRDASADSRRWGFVPHDHVIGRALFVYFSWDSERNRPRLTRLFRRVR